MMHLLEHRFIGTGTALRNPEDAARAINDALGIGYQDQEMFVVLTMDGRHAPIRACVTSIGTVNACLVHPRDVFRRALADNASGVIVAHNHPSGRLSASNDDILLTERLQRAGGILGIEVIDSLILAGTQFLSMREHGDMDTNSAQEAMKV